MERLPEQAMEGASGRHVLMWRAAGAFVVALALAGVGMMVAARTIDPIRPPQPPAAAAPAPSESASAGSTMVAMTRSGPTEISIPRIGVTAKIMGLGLDPTGAIEVPSLEQAQLAGWYRLGPSPGEVGNAVVVGHVDSHATGPAVFFNVGALRAGDVIEIKREDRSAATFVVDGVASYPKSAFPTGSVFGPSDRAGLRLVTCGGSFDGEARSYLDNVVVFATLASGPDVAP